jgi:hypothetical protein
MMNAMQAVARDVTGYIAQNPHCTKQDIQANLPTPGGARWTLATIEAALNLARNQGWGVRSGSTDQEVRYCVGRRYVMSADASQDDLLLEEYRRYARQGAEAINDILRCDIELARSSSNFHTEARERRRRARQTLTTAVTNIRDLYDAGVTPPRFLTRPQRDGTTLLGRAQSL